MKPSKLSIIVVGGALLLMLFTFIVEPNEVRSLYSFIVLGSVVWVYFDARKLNIRQYKPTFYGRGPVSYAWATGIFWIVLLPAYINLRQKIKEGKMPLRNGALPTNIKNEQLSA